MVVEPMDSQHDFSLLLQSRSPLIETIIDLIPCAMALWDPDHALCILNDPARRLTGYSERHFRECSSLWMNRIHPLDRDLFSAGLKKLHDGEGTVSCDYRFYPNGDGKEIWLREVSSLRRGPTGEIEAIISAYTNISDIKLSGPKELKGRRDEDDGGVIDPLVHEMLNNLQAIRMEIDLLRLFPGTVLESARVLRAIDCVNQSIQELREYFYPHKSQFSRVDPGVILSDVMLEMERKLQSQGVRLNVHCQSPLPLIWLDSGQFRRVLERVMEFSRVLLLKGGELEIEAGLEETGCKRYLKLQLITSSVTSLGVEEKDVFRPFLRVNGHQVGLGMTLASQIIDRYRGKIIFQKEAPQRGIFTILLEVR